MKIRRFPALLLLVAMLHAPTALAQDLPRFLEIATAGTGGAYYPIGVAMADILTRELDTQATAQVTGGAVVNVQLMQEGAAAIALTQSASAFNGLAGNAPFDAPKDRVRALLGSLTRGVFQIAVREGSGIETLADLPGKRVGLGPAGGSGIELASYVFAAAGFTIDDVRASFTAYDEAATALGDGNLDALVVQTAIPNPALAQLEATGKSFFLLPIPDDVRAAVNADHPYFARMDVPVGAYGGSEPIPTLYGANMVIVDRDLSEDAVYLITKTLFDNVDAIRASHPAAGGVTLEDAVTVPIPLHPGAERYYREAGVLDAAN